MLFEWNNFFVATAGSAAALTGLIFVGVSISLAKILATPKLPGRAMEALILLFTILIISMLGLVPGQTPAQIGIEWLLIGILVWGILLRTDLLMFRHSAPEYKKHHRLNILFSQCAVIPYIISGVMLYNGNMHGVYWLVPAFILSFIKALIDAWVLLVEINR